MPNSEDNVSVSEMPNSEDNVSVSEMPNSKDNVSVSEMPNSEDNISVVAEEEKEIKEKNIMEYEENNEQIFKALDIHFGQVIRLLEKDDEISEKYNNLILETWHTIMSIIMSNGLINNEQIFQNLQILFNMVSNSRFSKLDKLIEYIDTMTNEVQVQKVERPQDCVQSDPLHSNYLHTNGKEHRKYRGRCYRCGYPTSTQVREVLLKAGWLVSNIPLHRAKKCPFYDKTEPLAPNECENCGWGYHSPCRGTLPRHINYEEDFLQTHRIETHSAISPKHPYQLPPFTPEEAVQSSASLDKNSALAKEYQFQSRGRSGSF